MKLLKEPAIYLPLAFLIAMGLFCVACDWMREKKPKTYAVELEPDEIWDGETIPLEAGRNYNEIEVGYLGAPFQCDCGYSPALAHPSYRDCIESLKRRLGECGGN